MPSNRSGSGRRLILALVIGVLSLELAAAVLPRLLEPFVVLAVVAVVMRLVWFYTGRW